MAFVDIWVIPGLQTCWPGAGDDGKAPAVRALRLRERPGSGLAGVRGEVITTKCG